jgi:hypothetical protein
MTERQVRSEARQCFSAQRGSGKIVVEALLSAYADGWLLAQSDDFDGP